MSSTTTTTAIGTLSAKGDNTLTNPIPKTREEWRKALAELPTLEENNGWIPSFFFAHGQPALIPLPGGRNPFSSFASTMGNIQNSPDSYLAQFLRDFGKTLLEKYRPKGVVVFSAHWETSGERLVSDYGSSNPLLYDYFGFPDEMYKVDWRSSGDGELSRKLVKTFEEAGIKARLSPVTESRGSDGSPFKSGLEAESGLDHGVFVPFMHMFPNNDNTLPTPVPPVIEVSIDGDLTPEKEWKIGEAITALRSEGILILAGGLTIHNLRDRRCFNPQTAPPAYHEWDKACTDAVLNGGTEPESIQKSLFSLIYHPGFRAAHPREEHFMPIYIAAGAGLGKLDKNGGGGQGSKLLGGLYGAHTVAFGV